MRKTWLKEEIDYLRQYYQSSGSVGCSSFIDRPISAIRDKAFRLGISTRCRNGKSSGAKVISVICNNIVSANCDKHGVVEHRIRHGRSPRCSVCRSEYVRTKEVRLSNRKYENKIRKDPKRLYAHRLRVQLRQAITHKNIGCFRFLPYSPTELRKHLDDIKEFQNNRCPSCGANYDIGGFHVDHIIPLSSATTDGEVLALFGLKNLSLLCGSCNCSKGQSIVGDGV